MNNIASLIYSNIEKATLDCKDLIIKINTNQNFEKSYDFQLTYGELQDDDYSVETIESTNSIVILNYVLKLLIENDYFISFDCDGGD